jgi:hypothetical protein
MRLPLASSKQTCRGCNSSAGADCMHACPGETALQASEHSMECAHLDTHAHLVLWCAAVHRTQHLLLMLQPPAFSCHLPQDSNASDVGSRPPPEGASTGRLPPLTAASAMEDSVAFTGEVMGESRS